MNLQILRRFFRDDVDHTACGPAAIKGRCGTADNFNPFHIVHGNGIPIDAIVIGHIHRHAIVKDHDVRVAETAHFNAVGCFRQSFGTVYEDAHGLFQGIGNGRGIQLGYIFGRNDGHTGRNPGCLLPVTGCRNNHGFQVIVQQSPFRRTDRATTAQGSQYPRCGSQSMSFLHCFLSFLYKQPLHLINPELIHFFPAKCSDSTS